jgi:hypothetical protein
VIRKLTRVERLVMGAVLTIALLATSANAFAAKPTHETLTFGPTEFPAGLVCEGFPVRISAQTAHFTTFFDREGNPVRVLGRGASPATVTNTETGATFAFSHGAAVHITLNPDGSQTQVWTGHVLLATFPTDVPPGPSLALYSGRLVLSISPAGDTTFVSSNGKPPVDVCAELSA